MSSHIATNPSVDQMNSAKEATEEFEHIDDNPYREYLTEFHNDIRDYVSHNCFLFLDQDNSEDFLNFCLEGLNIEEVDADIEKQSHSQGDGYSFHSHDEDDNYDD